MTITSRVLLVTAWLVNSAVVVLCLPEEVLLPAWPLYAAYLLLPSLGGFWAVGALSRRWPKLWLGVGFVGVCSSLAVLWVQDRLLMAFALEQDPHSMLGGMLSNAFVTGHVWFGALLLTSLTGCGLLAVFTVKHAERSSLRSDPGDASGGAC
ncbi:hypothetical protein [Aquimonas sp.]|uniref:hypothetical protein n=1 Tax=Aquimonas sp. TaxID=1872588 RepID=UPI0037BE536A